MWRFLFTVLHMLVCVLGCFFVLDGFLLAALVWHAGFSSQVLHGSMLKPQSCACESATQMKIFSTRVPTKKKQTLF
jgi:hypothetical protein